ncbi:MAG: hypothetical protein WC621_02690 [Patescibacteria group bacterium]
MSSLELAIINTLTWFDMFKYPLTGWECWYYLWDENKGLKRVTPAEVLAALSKLARTGRVTGNFGYWQLAASPNYLPGRLEKLRWAIKKRQRAYRAARLLKHLPYVRLVAVVNTVALDAPLANSDIDFFIIARRRHIFTVRFLVTALIHILRWRRHDNYINNRICLSFYLSDDALNMWPLTYADDPYLRFWLLSLDVLYDDGVYPKFIQHNQWLAPEFPNWRPVVYGNQAPAPLSANSGQIAQVGSMKNNILEKIFKRLQMSLIKSHKNSRFGDGSKAVLASDYILKFHETDTRPDLAARFRERLATIL